MTVSAVELMRRIRQKRAKERAGMTPEEQAKRVRAGAASFEAWGKQWDAKMAQETKGMTVQEADAHIQAKCQQQWEARVKETEGMTEDAAYEHIIASVAKENAERARQHAASAAPLPVSAPAEAHD